MCKVHTSGTDRNNTLFVAISKQCFSLILNQYQPTVLFSPNKSAPVTANRKVRTNARTTSPSLSLPLQNLHACACHGVGVEHTDPFHISLISTNAQRRHALNFISLPCKVRAVVNSTRHLGHVVIFIRHHQSIKIKAIRPVSMEVSSIQLPKLKT